MPVGRQGRDHKLAGAKAQKSGAPGDAGAESRMGGQRGGIEGRDAAPATGHALLPQEGVGLIPQAAKGGAAALRRHHVDVEVPGRSEEHTSELQSLMRISYPVFCLKNIKTIISYTKLLHITILAT